MSSSAANPLPTPYLLFVGDIEDPRFAKTAYGLRDWAPEKCVGELSSSERAVTLGLARLSPAEAAARGITAKKVTPFLLQRIFELTEGRSLAANIALVLHNARLAAAIAGELGAARAPREPGRPPSG